MGRVKKGDRHQVSIKMPTKLLESLDALAQKNHRDRSSEIIVAIEEHLEKEEKQAQECTYLNDAEMLQWLKHNTDVMEETIHYLKHAKDEE